MSEKYNFEDAKKEAEKMQELVGDQGTAEDYDTANELIESSRKSNDQYEKLQKGRIVIEPPDGLHTWEISFLGEDPDEFRLFNQAARVVTEEYGGFWQSGHSEDRGYTAWELMKWPIDKSPYELVKLIEEKVAELKH